MFPRARCAKLRLVTAEAIYGLIQQGQNARTLFLTTDLTPEDLARYAAGLANNQGGRILLGVTPEGRIQGASGIHPLQITHALFELSAGTLIPHVEPIETPEGSVLVLTIPQSPTVIAIGPGNAPFWDGKVLREKPTGEALPAEPDYTATVPPTASLSDLDPVEVLRIRRILEDRRSDLAALPDLDLLHALGLLERQGHEAKPNLAGLLLAGTPLALKRHLPQAEISYYYHEHDDVEYTFREDILKPIPAALDRLKDLIQARNSFHPLTVGLFRLEVWDFDAEVYREAILNALVHRDWRVHDAVQIHHHKNRLEISNPGSFPHGITPDNILRHPPKRRNPRLAEALAKLGYIERAGVGVDKMYRLLIKYGKEPPLYLTYPDALTLVIRNPEFDEGFVRWVAEAQEKQGTFTLDYLIVLGHLKREGHSDLEALAATLQLPKTQARRLLHQMEGAGLIQREGRHYRLALPGNSARERVLQALEHGPLTRRQVEALTQTGPRQALRLLRQLIREGRVRRVGRGSAVRYEKIP